MKKDKIKLIIEIFLFIGALCVITSIYYFGGDDIQIDEDEISEVGIIKITDDNFEEEILNSEKVVVLEFSSNSCPPCITMIPTMISLAKNNEDIKVGTVNSSEGKADKILKDYEIEAYPTIMIFKDGKVKKAFLGATSEENILKEIK